MSRRRRGLSRRTLLGAAFGGLAVPRVRRWKREGAGGPAMVGSANALKGMRAVWADLKGGMAPLDAAIAVVKQVEADPTDHSVGLGGLPNEEGVVQLDAGCMDGRTHNSGAVGALENILHASEVARLVMERTDHCQLFGEGAYRFARAHGHPHTDLLTEEARRIWLRWRETMSDRDDRLPPPGEEPRHGGLGGRFERHGTVHCSVLAADGEVACATTTSGLAFKIPGRVGDSPIVGAGLYCDADVGSAGATGRGEAAILSCGAHAIVEGMRRGLEPQEAGLELLKRIVDQTRRLARWQPALLREDGTPAFNVTFYALDRGGRVAAVALRGAVQYAVAEADGEPRRGTATPLLRD